MKTITIPKSFGYPTVDIIANGKHYELNSGVEITVEDHLAEIIENAVALAPKKGKNTSKFVQRVEGTLTQITEDDLEGISTIWHSAFCNCYELIKVSFPNSITTIRHFAFNWCEQLESVRLPETPPTLLDVNAFGNLKSSCVFYCKTQASLDAYKAATNWSTLTGTYSFVVEA